MRDLKTFLVDYNTQRNSQPLISHLLAKALVAINALQVLSFLCLSSIPQDDFLAKTAKTLISLFNLPYFCKEIGFPLFLPLAILLILHIVYAVVTVFALLETIKYKKLKEWSLAALCKIEFYALNRESMFIFSLATGMEATFQPANFVTKSLLADQALQNSIKGLGIGLVAMSLIQFYWQTYTFISVDYSAESVRTGRRNDTSRILRGILFTVISALAYLETPSAVFACVGVYLLIDLSWTIVLGSHANSKMNSFSLRVTIIQVVFYFILLLPLWENSNILLTGRKPQRSIGILLIAPFFAALLFNLERRVMNYLLQKAVHCLTEKAESLSWLQVSQLNFFLKQTFSKLMNLSESGPELFQLLEAVLKVKSIEDPAFLLQVYQNSIFQKISELNPSESFWKTALKSSVHEFINCVYSSILSRERRNARSISLECYMSYIAFHKDITGNCGKAFIILAQVQKILGNSASHRAGASVELIERELQKQLAGDGSGKTITAQLLFTFLDRGAKVQLSIENYISDAFIFYGMMQESMINTKEIRSKGNKLLDNRASILKELDSLIKINEYHQQTLLLYDFFLSEIAEEKAEGLFLTIMNRIDIFHAAGYYTLYRQQKMNGNTTDLELLGWDMSIEFFANQLDEVSDYSVVVFNINPEHLGKIMKYSTNLSQLLGLEGQGLEQMNISDMEVTLFNPKNLKTLQDKILKGETNVLHLASEDRTMYFKHKNGSLIACAFVIDIEIYGRDPCITCYLRKKKPHEQEFILFSGETEPKLIGISKAFCKGITKSKSILSNNRTGSDLMKIKGNLSEMAITDMIPTLQTILPNVGPMWSESQVLLKLPNLPQFSMPRGHFIIDYIGRVQEMSLLKQKFGVIEIQSYFPTSVQKYDWQATITTQSSIVKRSITNSKPIKPSNWSPLRAEKDQVDITEVRSESDEATARNNLPDSPVLAQSEKFLTQLITERKAHGDDNLLRGKLQNSEGRNPFEEISLLKNGSLKKNMKTEGSEQVESPLRRMQSDQVDISSSEPSNPESRLERAKLNAQLRKAAKNSEKLTDGRASSIGSSVGAHLGFLRSLILEKKTPAVLKAVNAFGAIIFVTTVISIIVTYLILSNQYKKFSLFAQSAAFPGFIRTAASGAMIAGEIAASAPLFPLALRTVWLYMTSSYVVSFYPIYLSRYYQFVLSFDLQFLNKDLASKSISAQFSDFTQLNRNLSFYEANNVYASYAYKLKNYNFNKGSLDQAILNFTRTFIPPYYNMYGEVSSENFKSIYSLYDSSMITLDAIMGIGIVVCVLLMAIFLPIYWKYEKMETFAFTKLCSVSVKELEPHLKKILFSYEQMFGKVLPASKIFQENILSHLNKNVKKYQNSSTSLRGTETQRRILLAKKAGTQKGSNLLVLILVLFVSILLSGTYIVININFKKANERVRPLITDMEKMSNGFPSYFTTQMILMRLFNEVSNPNINATLPSLIEEYEGLLNESITAHKEMSNHLLNSYQRMKSSDVLSESTKLFLHNITSNAFCGYVIIMGPVMVSRCRTYLNNLADTGLIATANHVMDIMTQQLEHFKTNPTFATVSGFYFTSDISEFMTMNILLEFYLIQFLQSEQNDIADYAQRLLSQTNVMLGISLGYNIGLLILVWIPTIAYLRRRFMLSRSVFLLLPTKVLQRNNGIRNLFKTW